MIDLPLAKTFDEAKHPRAEDGKFTSGGGAPSFSQRPLREAGTPRRSLTRGEAWQRRGALWASRPNEIPIAYTGNREKERPVGSFEVREIREQIPKSMPVAQHQALFRGLKDIVRADRAPAIEKARERRRDVKGRILVPEGVTRSQLNRAYDHAALAALHDVGVLDTATFKMDDALKAEMTPLKPFMMFIQRRLGQEFRRRMKHSWSDQFPEGYRPYRVEFGAPFADKRRNKMTGDIRLRFRPNHELVKGFLLPRLAEEGFTLGRRAFLSRVPGEVAAATAAGAAGLSAARRTPKFLKPPKAQEAPQLPGTQSWLSKPTTPKPPKVAGVSRRRGVLGGLFWGAGLGKALPMAKAATSAQRAKVRTVMHEFKAGNLHSGRRRGKKGPVVTSRAQAIAIALSQAGLSKAWDGSKHPREHDGKFATKPAEAGGRFLGGAAGAVGGFVLGSKHGVPVGRAIGTKVGEGINAAARMAGHGGDVVRQISRVGAAQRIGAALGTHGGLIGAATLGTAGFLAGSHAGAQIDRYMRRRRAIKAGRLEEYERLNANVSVNPNSKKQLKAAANMATSAGRKIQRWSDYTSQILAG